MGQLLTFTIYQGETIYPMCGEPMDILEVAKKYGAGLHKGAFGVIKNADGVISEISPLSNILSRFGISEFPEDYQERFFSPVIITGEGITILEKTPEMLELETKVNEFIPTWSRYQGYLQQKINYEQSNLCLADAHRGLTYDEGFKQYVQRNMEDANLLSETPERPKLLLETGKE